MTIGSELFVTLPRLLMLPSAAMFAAVTAGVTSSAVRVPSAEILPAPVEALRRMPAASHVEAA